MTWNCLNKIHANNYLQKSNNELSPHFPDENYPIHIFKVGIFDETICNLI